MKTADQHEAFNRLSSFCAEKGIEIFEILTYRCRSPKTTKKAARRGAGTVKRSFEGSAYSMRHSFASRMMDGYNPNCERSSLEVSEDLGHHRTEVTAVYVGNMERAGEDTIPGLLAALVSNPMHSSTEDRLKMFFRELLVSQTSWLSHFCFGVRIPITKVGIWRHWPQESKRFSERNAISIPKRF